MKFFLILLIIGLAQASPKKWKCGVGAPVCKQDSKGVVDWSNVPACPATAVCPKGKALTRKSRMPSSACCCKYAAKSCKPQRCVPGSYWRGAPFCDCRVLCEYRRTCPIGQRWDIFECACTKISTTTRPTTTTKSCEPRTCGRNSIWRGAPFCGCRALCDFKRPCPADERWDMVECGCVKTTTTTRRSTTTAKRCPRVTCRNRYVWLESQCKCVCPPMACPKNTIRGNDCNCIPITTQKPCAPEAPCKRGTFWRPAPHCKCESVCGYTKECKDGYTWDIFACDCIRDPYYKTTQPSTTVSTKCPKQKCTNRNVWLEELCECVCPPMFCERGTKHGPDCSCIPDPSSTSSPCRPMECGANTVFNPKMCSCDCTLTEAQCSGPFVTLDMFDCRCLRHADDPLPLS